MAAGDTASVQYDLFGQVERDELAKVDAARLAAGVEAWRAGMRLDCCTGLPCPPGVRPDYRDGELWVPPPGHPDRYEFPQVRCGRCGEFTTPYGMVIEHDTGWTGCPNLWKAAGLHWNTQFGSLEEMSADRHDNQHHPMCVGCGHAWGIHTSGTWGMLPHEQASCDAWCGCQGYVAPEAAA